MHVTGTSMHQKMSMVAVFLTEEFRHVDVSSWLLERNLKIVETPHYHRNGVKIARMFLLNASQFPKEEFIKSWKSRV